MNKKKTYTAPVITVLEVEYESIMQHPQSIVFRDTEGKEIDRELVIEDEMPPDFYDI